MDFLFSEGVRIVTGQLSCESEACLGHNMNVIPTQTKHAKIAARFVLGMGIRLIACPSPDSSGRACKGGGGLLRERVAVLTFTRKSRRYFLFHRGKMDSVA